MLTEIFQPGSIEIILSNEDDARSVRLKNPQAPDTQVYVFTYGQEEGRFGVHIEYPDLQETNYSDTIEIHENISFNNLANLITINLEIPSEKVNSNAVF